MEILHIFMAFPFYLLGSVYYYKAISQISRHAAA